RTAQTQLRFPGKIVADEAGDRLFISDSNHNRIVVTRQDGALLDVIGAGDVGKTDGDYRTARFNRPQGMAFVDDILYVADTENHLLRKVDLKLKQVVTIAGTGRQAENGWPGWRQAERSPFDLGEETKPPLRYAGPPRTTALSSPWDLAIRKRESGRGPSAVVKSSEKKGTAPLSTGRSPAIVGDLYIAMAGTHQIWKMPLDEAEIGPFAGNSREDIVDGPLLPRQPYAAGFASFAQPSGLALDGNRLYVADSEASSIRNVPLGIGEVRTVVGTAALSHSRLFTFGDVDGEAGKVRLQHPLGVAFHDGKIYVADTYNNKVKVIDASRRVCKSLVGSGEPGHDDSAIAGGAGASFNEPSGLCYAAGKLFVADTNNHLIRTVDLEHDLRVATLQIPGLAAPEPQNAPTASKPSFNGAEQVQLPEAMVKPTDGAIRLAIKFSLPAGYKMNPLAPLRYYLEADGATGPIDRNSLGKLEQLDHPAAEFEIKVPIRQSNGRDALRLSMNYYYCQERAQGLCKVGAVEWTIPFALSSDAAAPSIEVPLEVTK
ncbi:MAG TPA: NHL repeat-containing protein, partial [Pirellulales bacterium]|nr:NHL repeat-containing protein [Pirellulales bacterium]